MVVRYGQGSTDLFCDALLIAGTAITTVAFALLAVEHGHPYDLLISAALLGVGIGLAFRGARQPHHQAVSNEQTGVASGMNTVMRTLGGALGGQLSATFIAAHSAKGHPAVTGFTETFVMATGSSSCALSPDCSCRRPRARTRRPVRPPPARRASAGGRRSRVRPRPHRPSAARRHCAASSSTAERRG